MTWVWLAFGFAALFCLLLASLSVRYILYPKKRTEESELARLRLEGLATVDAFTALPKAPFSLDSANGGCLFGYWIAASRPSKKAVILCHGFGRNAAHAAKYYKPFYDAGYHIICYDHRRCGQSSGRHAGMGYFETRDLDRVIDYTSARLGEDSTIGLHGESMGAATAILSGCARRDIAFVVADCPFDTLSGLLAHRLRAIYHLPPFPVLYLASALCRLRAGFTFGAVSPLNAIRRMARPDMPIFFIHGLADEKIPQAMSAALYQAKQGPKEAWYVPDAKHARCVFAQPDVYHKRISAFLAAHVT